MHGEQMQNYSTWHTQKEQPHTPISIVCIYADGYFKI